MHKGKDRVHGQVDYRISRSSSSYRDARVGEYRSIPEVAVVTSNDSKRDETCHKLLNLILLKVTMVNLLY